MKRIFAILAACCLLAAEKTNAQLEAGNVIVGADLANLNFGLNKGSFTTINLTPKGQWLIKNNVAIGGYLNFGIVTAKDYATYTSYGFGLLARYYIIDENINMLKKGNWFFEGSAGFQGENVEGGNSTNGLGLGFGPGYAYFITHNVALESLLKFDAALGFGNTTTTSNLNLSLGFQIYLPGRGTANRVRSNEQ